jgi:hypothetical protein
MGDLTQGIQHTGQPMLTGREERKEERRGGSSTAAGEGRRDNLPLVRFIHDEGAVLVQIGLPGV